MAGDLKTQLEVFLRAQVTGIDLNGSLVDQVSSLELLGLITRLEKHFAVTFANSELTVENLSSFDRLLGILEQHIR